jgi:leucyl/phenylalanyl-tRNA--protein transferase
VSFLPIPRLHPDFPAQFPPAADALDEPNGLLAWGGDLSSERLRAAYRLGIFPWYSQGQPPLWWSPDPRAVFDSDRIRLPRRFRRLLRRSGWVVRADTCFDDVVGACARAPRPGQDGTWILPAMREAYGRLHRLGHAHSIEVFDGECLVGGLYGVASGEMFSAESMFSGQSGGSKVALAALGHWLSVWGWPLVDAQIANPHLLSLGAYELPRRAYLAHLAALADRPGRPGSWAGLAPLAAESLADVSAG